MDDYFGKIVVLAPTKEREMKFKIGDMVRCVNDQNVEFELTVGSHYKVVDVKSYTVTVVNNYEEYLDYFLHRFELVPPQELTVEITQADYDEMYDRIELLESLLVDTNDRIAELEEFLFDKHKLLIDWKFRNY